MQGRQLEVKKPNVMDTGMANVLCACLCQTDKGDHRNVLKAMLI